MIRDNNFKSQLIISEKVKNIENTFSNCQKMSGVLEVNANPDFFDNCFLDCSIDEQANLQLNGNSLKLFDIYNTRTTSRSNIFLNLKLEENWDYYIDYNYNEFVLLKYKGKNNYVFIPNEYNGYKVIVKETEVKEDSPFYNNLNINYVIFESKENNYFKTSNLNYLFYGAENLIQIANLPYQASSLDYTFYNCKKLTNIDLQDFNNIISMNYTFYNCENLKDELIINSQVESYDNCLMNCSISNNDSDLLYLSGNCYNLFDIYETKNIKTENNNVISKIRIKFFLEDWEYEILSNNRIFLKKYIGSTEKCKLIYIPSYDINKYVLSKDIFYSMDSEKRTLIEKIYFDFNFEDTKDSFFLTNNNFYLNGLSSDISYLFYACSNLKKIYNGKFSNFTIMNYTFCSCRNLGGEITIQNAPSSNVTDCFLMCCTEQNIGLVLKGTNLTNIYNTRSTTIAQPTDNGYTANPLTDTSYSNIFLDFTLSQWSYTIDNDNQIIILNKYNGNRNNVYIPNYYNGNKVVVKATIQSLGANNKRVYSGPFCENTTIYSIYFDNMVSFENNNASFAFYGCTKLIRLVGLPKYIETAIYTFYNCTMLYGTIEFILNDVRTAIDYYYNNNNSYTTSSAGFDSNMWYNCSMYYNGYYSGYDFVEYYRRYQTLNILVNDFKYYTLCPDEQVPFNADEWNWSGSTLLSYKSDQYDKEILYIPRVVYNRQYNGDSATAISLSEGMFENNPNVKIIVFNGFDGSSQNADNTNGFFKNCYNLQEIYNYNPTSEHGDTGHESTNVFANCYNLNKITYGIDSQPIELGRSYEIDGTFQNCISLKNINLKLFDYIKYHYHLFKNCRKLTGIIDIGNLGITYGFSPRDSFTNTSNLLKENEVLLLKLEDWTYSSNAQKIFAIKEIEQNITNDFDLSNWNYEEINLAGETVIQLNKYVKNEKPYLYIPKEYDGKKITIRPNIYDTDQYFLRGNTFIKEVYFEDGVEFYDNNMSYAFYGCTSLQKVLNIPKNTELMNHTFYNCGNLKMIGEIPKTVKKMNYTFYGCSNLSYPLKIHANPDEYGYCFERTSNLIDNYLILSGESSSIDKLLTKKSTGSKIIKSGTLPQDYIKLKYIESTGNQYINTNVLPDVLTDFEIEFENLNENSTDEKIIIGCGDTPLFFNLSIKENGILYEYGDTSNIYNFESDILNRRFKISKKGQNIYLNNELLLTSNYIGILFQNLPIYLFARNKGANTIDRISKMKLFSCKIFEDGNIIRNFVPCQKSNGQVGLFDLINGNFYGSSGLDNFIASE